MTNQQLTTKYSMFLSSLIDPRYKWFYDDLVQSNQLHLMLIEEGNFDSMLGFCRTAMIKLQYNSKLVVNFLEYIIALKEYICIIPEKQAAAVTPERSMQMSLNESLEQDSRFEIFIEKFFEMLA